MATVDGKSVRLDFSGTFEMIDFVLNDLGRQASECLGFFFSAFIQKPDFYAFRPWQG